MPYNSSDNETETTEVMEAQPAVSGTRNKRDRFTLKHLDWGVLLVGVGISIITQSVLYDLGSIPALADVLDFSWLLLGLAAGMLTAHKFAVEYKQAHALLVIPAHLTLAALNHLLGL